MPLRPGNIIRKIMNHAVNLPRSCMMHLTYKYWSFWSYMVFGEISGRIMYCYFIITVPTIHRLLTNKLQVIMEI
jgi:hypothetical protein